MLFMKIKLYLQSAIETGILVYLTIADIDAFARVMVSAIAVPLALLTGYKLIQHILTSRVRYKREKLELKMKQEEVRRYFEAKYDTNRSSKEVPQSIGAEGEHVQG